MESKILKVCKGFRNYFLLSITLLDPSPIKVPHFYPFYLIFNFLIEYKQWNLGCFTNFVITVFDTGCSDKHQNWSRHPDVCVVVHYAVQSMISGDLYIPLNPILSYDLSLVCNIRSCTCRSISLIKVYILSWLRSQSLQISCLFLTSATKPNSPLSWLRNWWLKWLLALILWISWWGRMIILSS